MAGLGSARRLHLALWLCILGGARALRLSSARYGAPDTCSGITWKNPNVTFPLDVEGLLDTFNQDKSKFFHYLNTLGIDERLEMSVPEQVSTDCLGPVHIVFAGDCFARMSFEAFLASGGNEIFARELAEFEEMEGLGASTDEPSAAKQRQTGSRIRTTPSGRRFLQDSAARASYVFWLAGAPDGLVEGYLRDMVDHIHDMTPGIQIVFWIDALLHAWVGGERGWTESEQRKKWQTELHARIKEAFPGALLVWDSPSFIDVPLMKAKPAKRDYWIFEEANVSQVSAALAAQDREVMAALGVPLTSRWEVSNKYRGLQCDGMHASGHIAKGWNCPGFPAYEGLVLQSGLQQLCLKHQVPLCK